MMLDGSMARLLRGLMLALAVWIAMLLLFFSGLDAIAKTRLIVFLLLIFGLRRMDMYIRINRRKWRRGGKRLPENMGRYVR